MLTVFRLYSGQESFFRAVTISDSARLVLCIFHKPGSGLVEALLLADDACKYFDNKRFGIYEFFVGEVRKLPGVTQGWVQTIASFPFEFDIRS